MILPLFLKKFSAFLIAFALVVPGFYMTTQTQKAMAADAVVEVGIQLFETIINTISTLTNTQKNTISAVQNTITAAKTTYLALKEAVLDPIARLLGAQLSNALTQQMFGFIAKGNNGAPAFVTNPQQYFGSVAEESTQVFLTDLQNNRPDRMASINSAVRQRIIEENYVDEKKLGKSTFPGGDAAYQAYTKNPSNATCPTGDSRDCFRALAREENDPWSVYQFESARLDAKRAVDVKLAQDEVLAGSGFHTLKDCIEKDINANCTKYLNRTPGDTISKQISDYLGVCHRNLENADEVDEVINLGCDAVKSWMNGKGLANL